MPFDEMREWYDGYFFEEIGSVYSPNSVMEAIRNREFDSYWQSSETYETLREYIDIDYDGLQQDIIRMMGDVSVIRITLHFFLYAMFLNETKKLSYHQKMQRNNNCFIARRDKACKAVDLEKLRVRSFGCI